MRTIKQLGVSSMPWSVQKLPGKGFSLDLRDAEDSTIAWYERSEEYCESYQGHDAEIEADFALMSAVGKLYECVRKVVSKCNDCSMLKEVNGRRKCVSGHKCFIKQCREAIAAAKGFTIGEEA